MPPTSNGFAALGVPANLCAVLESAGIVDPSPIQAAVIADALDGRDVSGCAPTGSGKTLAFGLPLVARLAPARRRRPTALVLAPTRELAEQIAVELRPLARRAGHEVAAIYGGVGYGPQRRALDAGAELLVACPGRLEDLLASGLVDLSDVRAVVIDEADRMADMGFLPAVRRILQRTHNDRQVLLFSATFDRAVTALAAAVQHQPVRHEIAPTQSEVSRARHVFWLLPSGDRVSTTAAAIEMMGSTIVFCRTRHGADRLVKQLQRLGTSAAPIHGGRSQSQRSRALAAFASGEVSTLIATDVAARGVHVDDVAGVVHFDPPADGNAYIHRSGRTARAGSSGVVLSLVDPSAAEAARQLQRHARIEAELTPVRLTDLAPLHHGAPRPSQERRPERAPDRSRPSHRPRRPAATRAARDQRAVPAAGRPSGRRQRVRSTG